MFERIVDLEAERPTRWRSTLLAVSVLAHAAAAAAFIVAGMWNVEKLAVDGERLVYVSASPMALPPPGGDGKPPPLGRPKADSKPRKKVARADLQPVEVTGDEVEVEPGDEAGGGGDGDGDGVPGGHPDGVPGGDGTGINIGDGSCRGALCGTGDDIEIDEPPAAREVDAKVLNGNRVSGNARIAPPDEVKRQMVVAGEVSLTTLVKMCLDVNGVPTRLDLIRGSGYSDYDRKILREMRDWRYQPYEVRGQAIPACTTILFKFNMR